MDLSALWQRLCAARSELYRQVEPLQVELSRASCLDAETWGVAMAALSFEPLALTPARLQVRGPYTAAERYQESLESAAAKGLVAARGPGEFNLTATGRAETEHFIALIRAAMAHADPLPTADSEYLAALVDRLVQASLASPPPPDTWSIGLTSRLDPPLNAAPLPRLEQSVRDLSSYRDDAHLAAWRPSGISAAALESLTLLWRGEAGALDQLCAALNTRGHPPEVYVAALATLRERGFVEGPDEALRVTRAGRRYRDRVEADTDAYFYAPWACLDTHELGELGELAEQLCLALAGRE